MARHVCAGSRRAFLARLLGGSAAVVVTVGCAARFDRGYAGARVEVGAPPYFDRYPRTWYAGGYVYLIDGIWYSNHGTRWYRYRHEPWELRRARRHYRRRGRLPSRLRRRDRIRRRHRWGPPRRRFGPRRGPPRRRTGPRGGPRQRRYRRRR